MTTKRMKSDQVRTGWRDVLEYVRGGGSVVVEHYNRPVAQITPYAAETAMQNTQRLAEQVTPTLGDHANDFDLDAIVEEIGDTYGRDIVSIDAIPSDEYWAIVRRHDTTA